MNRLYLVVVTLFTSIHCMNLTMDPESELRIKKDQIRALIAQRVEEKEQQELNKQENFLHSFGQESINHTGELFCDLSLVSKQKVVSQLSYNQNLLVWFGAQGLDIPILTILCNGNEIVAHMYRNEPINKVLRDSVRAEEWKKFGKMDKHHFMLLKNSQIRLCRDVFSESIIFPYDVSKFMRALEILKKVEPEFDIKMVTDSVKVYPGFKDQCWSFWNVPLPPISHSAKKSVIRFIVYNAIGCHFLNIPMNLEPLATLTCLLALDFGYKYKISCANIKNNILPHQPTLTGAPANSKIYNIWQ